MPLPTSPTGIDGEPVVFLFSDTQIVQEGFLEDINNMLNSGEVPGMFAQVRQQTALCTMFMHVQQHILHTLRWAQACSYRRGSTR